MRFSSEFESALWIDIQSNIDEIIGGLNPDSDRWQKLLIVSDEFDVSVTRNGVRVGLNQALRTSFSDLLSLCGVD